MKVVSFCLWGDSPKYCVGAVRNAELAREIYPGWEPRFYCGNTIGTDLINELELANPLSRVLLHSTDPGDWRCMLWRFEAIENPDVEVMISRDCDSRLSVREAAAVNEWLESNRGFHTMHDHPWHSVPILGGMWGIKKGVFSELARHARDWAKKCEARWQCDQEFLSQVVWPVVQHDRMNHDDGFFPQWGNTPFPTRRQGLEFVGQVFDENENTVQEHLEELRKCIK